MWFAGRCSGFLLLSIPRAYAQTTKVLLPQRFRAKLISADLNPKEFGALAPEAEVPKERRRTCTSSLRDGAVTMSICQIAMEIDFDEQNADGGIQPTKK